MPSLTKISQSPIKELTSRCSGTCYPRDPLECLHFFHHFFDQPGGAKWSQNSEKVARKIFAVLSPHIDFRVSTIAYSHAFAPWLQAPKADVYLILGVGHHARQEWSIDGRDYLTPLGPIKIEAPLATDLVKQVDFSLGDHAGHEGEHSIEFALVQLQAYRRLLGIEKPFTFLPVLCRGLFDAVRLGVPPPPNAQLYRLAQPLKELLHAYGDRVQIIISIDGCHIGPRFGHRYAVTPQHLKSAQDWEEKLWEQVEHANLPGLFNHLGQDDNARYFDGVGALSLFLSMFGSEYSLTRTHYEQWFEPHDTSAVTFTSGYFA